MATTAAEDTRWPSWTHSARHPPFAVRKPVTVRIVAVTADGATREGAARIVPGLAEFPDARPALIDRLSRISNQVP